MTSQCHCRAVCRAMALTVVPNCGLQFLSHGCPSKENSMCQAPQMGQQLAHVRFVNGWVYPCQPDCFGKRSGKVLESCPVPLIRITLHRRLAARAKCWHVINTTKLSTFSLQAHQPNVTHFQGDSHSWYKNRKIYSLTLINSLCNRLSTWSKASDNTQPPNLTPCLKSLSDCITFSS